MRAAAFRGDRPRDEPAGGERGRHAERRAPSAAARLSTERSARSRRSGEPPKTPGRSRGTALAHDRRAQHTQTHTHIATPGAPRWRTIAALAVATIATTPVAGAQTQSITSLRLDHDVEEDRDVGFAIANGTVEYCHAIAGVASGAPTRMDLDVGIVHGVGARVDPGTIFFSTIPAWPGTFSCATRNVTVAYWPTGWESGHARVHATAHANFPLNASGAVDYVDWAAMERPAIEEPERRLPAWSAAEASRSAGAGGIGLLTFVALLAVAGIAFRRARRRAN